MMDAEPQGEELLGSVGSHELARVSVSERDGAVVVAVAGEVDISNVERVSEVIFAQPNTGEGLIVDLSDVRYLDSTAVSLLHDLGARLRNRAQRLIVVSPIDTPPRRILELTALYVNAPLAEDLDLAVKQLRDIGLR
jgi:anti-anti-sigma factor